jgi:hypothetical protein
MERRVLILVTTKAAREVLGSDAIVSVFVLWTLSQETL